MKKRKLPPHQYSLRLPKPEEDPVPVPPSKAHLVFYDGQWHMFRSKWKSRFRVFPKLAANITRPTIDMIRKDLPYQLDAWRYGYQKESP